MSNKTNIIRKIRTLINDLEKIKSDVFEYTSSNVFLLEESNVNSISEVTINGSTTTNYTYNSSTNKVTINDSLSVGDIIIIKYLYYAKYSDDELSKYIEGAMTYIENSGLDFSYYDVSNGTFSPLLTRSQENLISLVVSILINPNYSEIRTNSFRLVYPNNKSKEEKINDVIRKYKYDRQGYFETL